MLKRQHAILVLSAAIAASVLPAQAFPFRVPGRADAAFRKDKEADKQPAPTAEMLQAWTDELRNGNLLRAETALRNLIAAGEPGASAVRTSCDAADPTLSLRARQVFGAVHGTSPEVHGYVTTAVARVAKEPWSIAEVARAILDRGPAAADLAMRLLYGPHEGPEVAPPAGLAAELTVRRSLEQLAAGQDRNDHARQSVLTLSAAGTAPLWRAVKESSLDRQQRLHALWLYGIVGAADRAVHFAELVSDHDASVRSEALAQLCDALRPADFTAVALRIGGNSGPERMAVAQAAARVVPRADLDRNLHDRNERTAALAALALGCERSEPAQQALVKALDQLPSELAAEAMVLALGEFNSEAATKALVHAYAGQESARVRAGAISSLRNRTGDRTARIGLCAAVFDSDASVRLLAAEALGASNDKSAAPALILAANRDDGSTLQARAVSALSRLLPEATAGLHSARAWRHWLDRQASDLNQKELPWYRPGREAANMIEGVRRRIASEFFHFGKSELVDPEQLNEKARAALQKVEDLESSGDERLLLTRLLQNSSVKAPEDLLSALGTIPFTSGQADVVRLCDAAANAMVQSLGDPYSRLAASNDAEGKPRPEWLPGILEDDANNGFMTRTEGDHRVLVDFVLYDAPAWWAGMQRGDQLIKVGDDFATGMPEKELRKKLRSEADFTILREGWNRPVTVHLKPDDSMKRRMVSKAMLPGQIGYVRLKMFELGCSSHVERAIADLEREGAKALILDLRNNPGGTVADATSIVDLFLPEGKNITTTEVRTSKDENKQEEIKSTGKGRSRTLPLCVLVNDSSASASEMTSGSLQGNGRAVIVGQISFGKGIGQSGMAISGFSSDSALGRNRSQYVLALTMMRYYVPEGKRSIHGTGVQPDLQVRERNLKGVLLDKVMRAVETAQFAEYVAKLQKDHAELCLELCRFDGGDSARYPEFNALAERLARLIDADELRRQVRERLRRELLQDADDARFAPLQCDLQEDRTLRSAIGELCTKANIDADKVPEYSGLR